MDDRCYWIWLQSALGVQSRLEEAIAYFGTARRLYEAGELEWKLAGLFTARQLEKLRSQRLTQAEEILKQCAGKRKQTIYSNVAMPTGSQYAAAMPSVPVNVELGGVTVFVMDLEKLEKF